MATEQQQLAGDAKSSDAKGKDLVAHERFVEHRVDGEVKKIPLAAGEDWHEDVLAAKPPVDPKLAGLYRVKHGTLFFQLGKHVQTGRTVRLSAADASMFLERDLVERVSA